MKLVSSIYKIEAQVIHKSNKLSKWIKGELKIVDEAWLKDLNRRNLALEGEDSSKWNCATAICKMP